MVATPSNALNIKTSGLVTFDGTSSFSADTVTQHDILVGGASNAITSVAPSATSGVPVISQGAAADPAFGTAVVAGGGTGVTSNTAYAVLTGGTTSTNPIQSIASVGTAGQVLTSNGAGALPTFQTAPAPTFAPNSIIQLVDDFFSYDEFTNTSSTVVAVGNYLWGRSGAPALASPTITSTNPGILSFGALSASPTTGGIFLCPFNATGNDIVLGGGAITLNWVIKLGALSGSGNTYIFGCGLIAGINSGDPTTATDGIMFTYTDTVNSGNFVIRTIASSSATTKNTSNAASATGYHNFGITIDAGATSIGFFYDGTQVANSPIVATIPTVSLKPFCWMFRTAGTVASPSLNIDLFYLQQTLTTPR